MTDAIPSTLGLRLRCARALAGMTRHRVAVAVECSPDTLGRWERDETEPDAGDLARLASAYGTTVAALMGET